MRGREKSKKVSWASDVDLCQVRLFLLDDSPSQVELGTQDHLQAKASWLLSPTASGADDNLPPGFEEAQPANLWRNKLSQIPLMKWSCPPRFVLDFTWQVVAGEESKEVEIQNQREKRMLEAVYPRPSAIPPNPSVLTGIQDSRDDDLSTPVIPITPVEDEDIAGDMVADPAEEHIIPMNSQSSAISPALQSGAPNHPNSTTNAATGIFPGVEADVAAAAYAALTAIMASNDQGSLIDQDLLIKILSNRDSIENLIANHKAATNPQTMPMSRPTGVTLSDLSPVQTTRAESLAPPPPPPSLAAPPNGPFYPPPHRAGLVPNLRPPPPPPPMPEAISAPSLAARAHAAVKDINYYKSLIQQHGGERQDNPSQFGRANLQDSVYLPTPRDLKPKIMKPCIYFNSSRGCRHGANCSYQHDVLSQQRASSMPEVQSAKRMKLDREITGA